MNKESMSVGALDMIFSISKGFYEQILAINLAVSSVRFFLYSCPGSCSYASVKRLESAMALATWVRSRRALPGAL